VIGSRYLPASPDTGYRTPLARRLGMHFSTTILRLATGLLVRDTTSGFRALDRRAFLFASRRYPTDHPEAEALLLFHQAGFRIVEVPVRMRSRIEGQSLFTVVKAALYPIRVAVGFLGLIAKRPDKVSR
jgi:hypothetical protein